MLLQVPQWFDTVCANDPPTQPDTSSSLRTRLRHLAAPVHVSFICGCLISDLSLHGRGIERSARASGSQCECLRAWQKSHEPSLLRRITTDCHNTLGRTTVAWGLGATKSVDRLRRKRCLHPMVVRYFNEQACPSPERERPNECANGKIVGAKLPFPLQRTGMHTLSSRRQKRSQGQEQRTDY